MGRRWFLGLSLTTGPVTLTARQASSSETSDDDGRLTRFSGIAIAIRPTTELLHRSPPAHNSLFGCAIERAGDAKRNSASLSDRRNLTRLMMARSRRGINEFCRDFI